MTDKILIYKITSPSGKIYIGQTWDVRVRLQNYRQHHCKNQRKLYNSLNKYGFVKHTFEVIQYYNEDVTQEILDEDEIKLIAEYEANGFRMLNIAKGGRAGKHAQETKDKMSDISSKYIYKILNRDGKVDEIKSLRKYCKENDISYAKLLDKFFGYTIRGVIVSNNGNYKILSRETIDGSYDEMFDKILNDRKIAHQNHLRYAELRKPSPKKIRIRKHLLYTCEILCPNGETFVTNSVHNFTKSKNISRWKLLQTYYGYTTNGLKINTHYGYKILSYTYFGKDSEIFEKNKKNLEHIEHLKKLNSKLEIKHIDDKKYNVYHIRDEFGNIEIQRDLSKFCRNKNIELWKLRYTKDVDTYSDGTKFDAGGYKIVKVEKKCTIF